MEPNFKSTYIAFNETKKIANGGALEVALKVKRFLEKEACAQILIFDAATSKQVEFDFRGTPEQVVKRLKEFLDEKQDSPAGPGRPKLGVISREISLLPRHWDWLATQSGGASAAIRKLVDEAKKKNSAQDQIRQSQDAVYKFMSVMAGNLPHFEDALRAMYAKDLELFETLIAKWPKDVRLHISELAEAAFKAK